MSGVRICFGRIIPNRKDPLSHMEASLPGGSTLSHPYRLCVHVCARVGPCTFSLNLSRAEIDTQVLEMGFHVELTDLLLWSIGLGGGVGGVMILKSKVLGSLLFCGLA